MIRRPPNSLCPPGRIHSKTHGCKGSLSKVRKGKFKREQNVSSLSVLLEPTITNGKGRSR
jgi:hypothetical protein